MRVLMLARYLPPAGSTTHIYTLSSGLVERGHEVVVGSAGHDGSRGAIVIYEQSVSDGIRHVRFPFPLTPDFGRLGRLKQGLSYLVTAPLSLYRIARIRPDVIHVHYPVTSYLAAVYRLLTGTRFISTHHASDIPKHPLHRRADIAVAISQKLRDELIRDYGYEPACVRLIHHGISPARFGNLKDTGRAAALEAVGLSHARDKTVIGYLGAIAQHKGLDILLRAVAGLDASRLHLVIVGDGESAWLRALVSEYGCEESVSLFGFSRPEPFYAAIDVFVLPSRKEAFGLAAAEAMMSGALTVRSYGGGASDQIDDGVTGFVFENGNADQLRTILDKLIRDPSTAAAIAARGQEFALKDFGADQMLDRIESEYEILVENRGKRRPA